MESVIASFQTRNHARALVRIVDADEQPRATAQLGVQKVPAVVFLVGRRLLARFEGRATLDELEAVLDAAA